MNPDEVVAVGAALQGAALGGPDRRGAAARRDAALARRRDGRRRLHALIPRNTTIPTEKSEIFTTSVDNQRFVPIHVLQGEREMAADNRSLARFELTGIPPAPRGVPKIQVTFRIDANGIVASRRRTSAPAARRGRASRPTSGLQHDEIDRLVDEGERFKETDELRRELAELRNQAETLLYTTEQALEGYADLIEARQARRGAKPRASPTRSPEERGAAGCSEVGVCGLGGVDF